MFKQRVITASILAPVALGAVFLLPPSLFSVVMGLVTLIGAWEWANFAVHTSRERYAFVAVVVLIMAILSPLLTQLTPLLLILTAGFWVFAISRVLKYPSTLGVDQKLTKLLIGLCVLIPSWVAMVGLKSHEQGHTLLVMLFLLVWGADIGAYFAGKRFGRVKLIPKVSPGKTREGMYGGLLACLLIGLGFSIGMGVSSVAVVALLMLALITGVVSVFGDLFESMFKRERGIKDSGTILPGHGGVLDRIDSLTAAAPIFLLGILILPIL